MYVNSMQPDDQASKEGARCLTSDLHMMNFSKKVRLFFLYAWFV